MSRLTSAIIGRDAQYFILFEQAAANLVVAAELLDRLFHEHPEHPELAEEIKEREHEGDRITAELIDRLNHTFVTPIEREDIVALASALDDVADEIEEAADLLGLYKIEAPMEQSQVLARIVLRACREVCQAMPLLRDFGDISVQTTEIHRLENEGDRTVREATAALFEHGIDPMTVIRWKDIYERLEGAIDATESVANVLANIVIKNA